MIKFTAALLSATTLVTANELFDDKPVAIYYHSDLTMHYAYLLHKDTNTLEICIHT